MKNSISEFVNQHSTEKNKLFVLKGFHTDLFHIVTPSLDQIIENKMNRMVQLSQQTNPIISFDEFICLFDLILMQYFKIYIIENDIYLNLYPIGSLLPKEKLCAMLNHFEEEVDTDSNIGELSEYTYIYRNFIHMQKGNACCYNLEESKLKNEKITRVTFGAETTEIVGIDALDEKYVYMNLCSERDYYELIQQLINSERKYAVTWENYADGKELAKRALQHLSSVFPNRVFAYLIPCASSFKKANKEIYLILESYWHYSSFRNLKFYDVHELENSKKKVIEVSQECIVCDLIDQVENCMSGKNFRDVFVTAPTGAGKSLMFQLPAIYLSEKYNLLTLVITPLIGLMNDQVKSLQAKGYMYARTINSDISPVVKQEITEDIANGNCHILYLSPESLLSKSDIEQLIGKRKIGMLIVDEAHIVTTWGKQFRPDYWYLGDHVQKLRQKQSKCKDDPSPFIIATFTATAIYEGSEDMYHETLNSLHMIDPITYLGYIRRSNISIDVTEVAIKSNKTEYEINKFDSLIEIIDYALMRNQKALIYFPTVALINCFYDYCYSKKLASHVARYHGQMESDKKGEGFDAFFNGDKLIMLATKAFGMGIDISNIVNVVHFAPTGNVCDYMQEIGRAARNFDIDGHAIYRHMPSDFKHINKLHGLSAIRKYQLIEVMKKILELYINNRYSESKKYITKKRNEMLVDAESFAYIFDGPLQSDENNLINKVKTAMLLIQKDYENRGFAPFYMRPIPLFAYGYFAIEPEQVIKLTQKYKDVLSKEYQAQNIYEVNLKRIWEADYQRSMSFPKFKYLLYSHSQELLFNQIFSIKSAMAVDVYKEEYCDAIFSKVIHALKTITNKSAYQGTYIIESEIVSELEYTCNLSHYKAESIFGVFIAASNIYQREYSHQLNGKLFNVSVRNNSEKSYFFMGTMNTFYKWLNKKYEFISNETVDEKMYIVDETGLEHRKQISTVMGILEAMGVLRFKSLGGSNSQIYIYVNETKTMQMVRDTPNAYKNKLLETINRRHEDSVRMLCICQSKKGPHLQLKSGPLKGLI